MSAPTHRVAAHGRSPARITALAALALVGCTDDPSPSRCPTMPFVGTSSGPVTIRDAMGNVWAEGTEVELVYGPQGGYMVLPVAEIDGSLADGDRPCLRVAVENADPGGTAIFDEFRTHEVNLDFTRTIDGDLATEPIFDQIRWSPLPSGTPLRLTITVRGDTFAVQSAVTVMLVPER